MTIYCINLFLRERVIFSELENSKKNVFPPNGKSFVRKLFKVSCPRSGKFKILD